MQDVPDKATAYAFTWNNPGLEPLVFHEQLLGLDPKYFVFQLELGRGGDSEVSTEVSGTRHYQGYIHFKRQRRYAPLVRLFPGIWFQRARAGAAVNKAYCTKEDTRVDGPWEHGTLPGGQGTRNDLNEFYSAVKAGKRLRDVIETHTSVVARYPRFYQTIVGLQMPTVRDGGVKVILSIGPTGVGKTRAVMEAHAGSTDFYRIPIMGDRLWVDNYDRHKYALIDDFAGAASKVSLTALLQLLDRYPVQAPTKGGHAWWYPERIYVTTNIHPALWYNYRDRYDQYHALCRRFTTVLNACVELDEDEKTVFFRDTPPRVD